MAHGAACTSTKQTFDLTYIYILYHIIVIVMLIISTSESECTFEYFWSDLVGSLQYIFLFCLYILLMLLLKSSCFITCIHTFHLNTFDLLFEHLQSHIYTFIICVPSHLHRNQINTHTHMFRIFAQFIYTIECIKTKEKLWQSTEIVKEESD